MQGRFITYTIWLGLAAYLGYVFHQLALFDSLSSIANDSINYLAMARYLSPWQAPSEAVRHVWTLQDFPPLFPLMLAFTGAAHSLWVAHALVVLTGVMVLPVFYQFARKSLSGHRPAVIAVVVFALSPGYLLGLQGILSEALYLLLSLLFLWLYPGEERANARYLLLFGILLTAVLLTRTIGFALLLSVLAQGFSRWFFAQKTPVAPIVIVLTSLLIYFAMMAWLGPDRDSHYSSVVREMLGGADMGSMFSLWLHHLNAILEAWQTHWLLYWVSGLAINYIVVLLMLLFAIAEWLIRLGRNELAAWYLLFYLGVLSIWPHPGQMLRLLLPVVPILLMYAIAHVGRWSSRLPREQLEKYTGIILLALLLVSVLPSHAFMHGRLEMAASRGLVPVYEIFRKPDAGTATRDLLIHNQMLVDFSALSNRLKDDARLLYFSPTYPAVLGNIPADKLNYPVSSPSNRRYAYMPGNYHVLLTALHPRKTREGYDGFDGEVEISGWTEKSWCSFVEAERLQVSCLYRVTR